MTLPVLTELEAVNAMLLLVGEQPVNTLDDTPVSAASTARRILTETVLKVCTRSWWFNSRTQDLIPTAPEGYLFVPNNTIGARSADQTKEFVLEHDLRLYDLGNQTYVFTDSSVSVELIRYVPFDELPMQARLYCQIVASRAFQLREQGDQTKLNYTQREELEAKVDLEAEEMRNRRDTMFDNARVSFILNKRVNPVGGNLRV